MGCFRVLDRRIKTLILLYYKRNRSSAECRNTCPVRKNRDGARQKTETSLEKGLRQVGIYTSRAAGKQDNLYCSVSTACKNTIMKQGRVNGKRSQSSRQELKASKRKQWLRRGKWRGEGVENSSCFPPWGKKDSQGWRHTRTSLGWKHTLKKINKTFPCTTHNPACLATKAAVLAKTATKTSVPFYKACVKHHLLPFYPCYL